MDRYKVICDLAVRVFPLLHALLLPSYRCTVLTWARTRQFVDYEEQGADCKESHLSAETVSPVVPCNMRRLLPSVLRTNRVKRHYSGFSGSPHHGMRAKAQHQVRSMATSLPQPKDALSCPHKTKVWSLRLIAPARAFRVPNRSGSI